MAEKDKETNPLDNLYEIVGDLWGTLKADKANQAKPASPAKPVYKTSGTVDLPLKGRAAAEAEAEPEAEAEKTAEEAPAENGRPPFEAFWKMADETVDWTDALASPMPTDGTVTEEQWRIYHEKAEQVLNGDIRAYTDVMRAARPLDDLKPYTAAFKVRAVDADTLSVTFEALPGQLHGTVAEARHYLAGLALRCARDLTALLPVLRVEITGTLAGEELLRVTLTRREMHQVRFAFIDPETYIRDCGGVFGRIEPWALDEEI